VGVAEYGQLDEPRVKIHPAAAERILLTLARPSDKFVNRHRDVQLELAHQCASSPSVLTSAGRSHSDGQGYQRGSDSPLLRLAAALRAARAFSRRGLMVRP
jgi:hypothetical protein